MKSPFIMQTGKKNKATVSYLWKSLSQQTSTISHLSVMLSNRIRSPWGSSGDSSLGGVNRITQCHKKDMGNGAEWKQLDFFLYKAIIRKRNKLTALIWGMLNSDVRQTLVWTGKTLQWEIPTGNARDGSLYFYFWKVIFKNTTVLHTLEKQSNTNKEAKGEHTFWKPESFILYLFK